MIETEHCLSRKIMRSYRRDFACRPPLCHECEDAMKAAGSRIGDATPRQGEHHDVLPPIGGKSVALGSEASDPTLQLANIVVELDDGCVERIRMNDNESAEEVATKVCRKNDLPDKFIALLAEHIIDRYPTRPVDQKKEEVTETSTEPKESKTVKNQSESKAVKNQSESKTEKKKSESPSESSTSTETKGSTPVKNQSESKTVKNQSESKTVKNKSESKTVKNKSESPSESSTSTETKGSTPVKNQSESKMVKNQSESKTGKNKSESKTKKKSESPGESSTNSDSKEK